MINYRFLDPCHLTDIHATLVAAFADYAIMESDYEEEFSDPPHDFSTTNLVPIHEFLQLARHQRIGKLPTVALPGESEEPVIKVASPAVVTQTSDQLHLWKTLQEIAGEDNPHVKSTADTLRAEHGAQQKLLLDNMQRDMGNGKLLKLVTNIVRRNLQLRDNTHLSKSG